MKCYKIQTGKTCTLLPHHHHLLGIDPGTHNGVSIYDTNEDKFVYSHTFKWWDLNTFLTSLIKSCSENSCTFEVIIEDIIGNKITFQRGMIFGAIKSGNPQNIAMAIGIFDKRAQDVGGNKRDEQHLLDWFEQESIIVHRVVPKRGSKTKLNAKQLKEEAGIISRTSPHTRDSIMLIQNYLTTKIREKQ